MTLQDGYDENMTYFAHYTVAVAVGDVRGEEEEINITCVYTKMGENIYSTHRIGTM